MELLSSSLSANRARLEAILGLPGNAGIHLHPMTHGLLLWVEHLASDQALATADRLVRNHLPEAGPLSAASVTQPVRAESTVSVGRVVERVLAGWVAALADGSAEAVLLSDPGPIAPLFNHGRRPYEQTIFGRELGRNLAAVRNWLPSPLLRAVPLGPGGAASPALALLYHKEKAAPGVVRAVRRWAAKHAREGTAATGAMVGTTSTFGLLPRFDVTTYVDKAVLALDAGYVVLLVDGVGTAYVAPVTEALWLIAPSDGRLAFPIRRWLQRYRQWAAFFVMLLPGAALSLLNYHQEMIPTAFLLAAGSARESAPFATLFELVLLEGLTEVSREVSFRLPLAVPIGFMLIAHILITSLAVMGGFVGPLPGVVAVAGAMISLTLPSHGLAYLVRIWRFLFLLGANVLGFLGMATIYTLMMTYVSQVRRWGVPYLGPSGLDLTSPESWSARPPRPKGAKGAGKGKSKAALR